jgi:hypothetical protein
MEGSRGRYNRLRDDIRSFASGAHTNVGSTQFYRLFEFKYMKDSPPASTPTATLDALMNLYDEAFVTGAYMAILGRPPDASGLENYLTQVRTGVAKRQILRAISDSPEGRLRCAELSDLRKAVADSQWRAESFWKRLYRPLLSMLTDSTERQLRVIDNRLYVVERSVSRQASQLSELLALVKISLLQLPDPQSCTDETEAKSAEPTQLGSLSPSVRRTYAELKAAILAKTGN